MKTNTARSYKDLVVWQKGIALAKLVYGLRRSFPSEQTFGIVAQMRQAAVSVPSNVAEGQPRRTTGEFIQFISHAEGSGAELAAFAPIDEIRRMLNGLRRKLSARQ